MSGPVDQVLKQLDCEHLPGNKEFHRDMKQLALSLRTKLGDSASMTVIIRKIVEAKNLCYLSGRLGENLSAFESASVEVMFGYAHLPAHLKEVSQPFGEVVHRILTNAHDCGLQRNMLLMQGLLALFAAKNEAVAAAASAAAAI